MDPHLLAVFAILAVTILLIVTEAFRIDVVAILAMLALVWVGSITPAQARTGFSSNAVIAIIGVMIMGRGLYKSGVTEKIATFILRVAGEGKRKIISTVSITVGVMSGFIQNIGAAALFLPVMVGISKREQISISQLLMPMGFAALLGGTLTMVGTSSLIVLNDLLSTRGLETIGLFAVTPVGIALLLSGVAYFFVAGHWVFPSKADGDAETGAGARLLNAWGLSDTIFTFEIPSESPIVGATVEASEMGSRYNVNLLGVRRGDGSEWDVWEDFRFAPGQKIVLQGRRKDVMTFADDQLLHLLEKDQKWPSGSGGYLEVVVPARSSFVGKTVRDVPFREAYGAQVVLFFSDSQVVEEGVPDRTIRAGDTLVLQGKWENLQFFKESEDFITVTPIEYEPKHPENAWLAMGSFVGAVLLVMATPMPISMGFLTGALVMILTGVLTVEDAYRAVEWKVIFLIAGLIPIGIAMETSGAASLLAGGLVGILQGIHPFLFLLVLGGLMTVFSLLMSNVAATVLTVPLVLQLAGTAGLSGQVLALQVGICAANSFILPTHHVNALLMTPGGYRVPDYLRAGSILSLIFVTVSSAILYLFYMA